eukprot:516173_1
MGNTGPAWKDSFGIEQIGKHEIKAWKCDKCSYMNNLKNSNCQQCKSKIIKINVPIKINYYKGGIKDNYLEISVAYLKTIKMRQIMNKIKSIVEKKKTIPKCMLLNQFQITTIIIHIQLLDLIKKN